MEEEKEAALPLYRCLKPLWWTHVKALKEAGDDPEAIRRSLDASEACLTKEMDFRPYMESHLPENPAG